MPAIRHSDVLPDTSALLRRYAFKAAGPFTVPAAPAGATHYRTSGAASGGQGADVGGHSAFAHRKGTINPGEVLIGQIGATGTAGALGDSWLRRQATGETLLYVDRGHGSGGIQGDGAKCIGDTAVSGTVAGPGSDANDPFGLGFGGRPASARRAPGPGGGGQGVAPDGGGTIRYPAGVGKMIVEFYSGDPGLAY